MEREGWGLLHVELRMGPRGVARAGRGLVAPAAGGFRGPSRVLQPGYRGRRRPRRSGWPRVLPGALLPGPSGPPPAARRPELPDVRGHRHAGVARRASAAVRSGRAGESGRRGGRGGGRPGHRGAAAGAGAAPEGAGALPEPDAGVAGSAEGVAGRAATGGDRAAGVGADPRARGADGSRRVAHGGRRPGARHRDHPDARGVRAFAAAAADPPQGPCLGVRGARRSAARDAHPVRVRQTRR